MSDFRIAEDDEGWAIEARDLPTIQQQAKDAIDAGRPVVFNAHFIAGRLQLESAADSPALIVGSFFESSAKVAPKRRRGFVLLATLPVLALAALALLAHGVDA
jgi:hypothetical protein